MNSNTPIILILLSIGLFYTFTGDKYEEAKGRQALANEYSGILDNISDIAELRDTLELQYEALPADDIERINKILPENNDTVRLALDLDDIAARHGIALKTINTNTGSDSISQTISLPDENSSGKVTVNLKFVASYNDFLDFMADLESNLRLMDIKSLSFRSDDKGLYDYDVSFTTYWLR